MGEDTRNSFFIYEDGDKIPDTMSNKDKIMEILWQSGDDIALVHTKYPGISVKEVKKIKASKLYKSFKKEKTAEYTSNLDNHILGKLSEVERNLTLVHPSDKNYPHLLKAYVDLIKLTQPIAERLSKKETKSETQNTDYIIQIQDGDSNEQSIFS